MQLTIRSVWKVAFLVVERRRELLFTCRKNQQSKEEYSRHKSVKKRGYILFSFYWWRETRSRVYSKIEVERRENKRIELWDVALKRPEAWNEKRRWIIPLIAKRQLWGLIDKKLLLPRRTPILWQPPAGAQSAYRDRDYWCLDNSSMTNLNFRHDLNKKIKKNKIIFAL